MKNVPRLFLILLIFILSGQCKKILEDEEFIPLPENKVDLNLTDEWVEMGPAPIDQSGETGRISAIAVSPTDTNLYYAGGADGGVWKSLDGGISWHPLTDHLPTTAIGALAVHPKDDNIVYAGSGEANFANHSRYGLGLYKTTDGGQNWEVMAEESFAGRCFSKILIHPQNPDVLYASITHAGGLPSFNFNIAAARGHEGSSLPLGVWKSVDGGANWQQLNNGLPVELSATDMIMHPASSSILYAAIGHVFGDSRNGIYKTVDNGLSWVKLAAGLPTSGLGRISLAMSATNPNRLYASIVKACDENGGGASTLSVFRSDDGGDTWASKYPGSIHATYGWYLNVIIVSPVDENTAFVGGVVLHKTTDGGHSWIDVQGNQHVDFHALAFDATGRLLTGTDGGVFRSVDLGDSWFPINGGLGTIQFYAGISLDPDNHLIMYGGTQDNGTLKRVDSGKSDWIWILGGDGGWTGVRPDNPLIIFNEYQGTGNLFKSVNAGLGFNLSNSGIDTDDFNCFLPPYTFNPENSLEMYYATHRMYKSVNGGDSWQVISEDLTGGDGAAVRAFAVSESNPQTLYASTNDGRVLVSNDGGKTWDLSLTDIPGWPRVMRQFAIDPFNHLTAYLAVAFFGTDQLLITQDGGNNWSSIDDHMDIPVNSVALDYRLTPHVIYIGTECGVYRSVDGGSSWNKYGKGLPNCAVNDIVVDTTLDRLVVATQGRGMWMVGL
jgi:photosystem II stability/assembly factor-like uncharacterized protein